MSSQNKLKMNKTCNICLTSKDVSEYYKNDGCADGYQNRCKECTKQKSKERLEQINSDPELKEKENKRHREKYHRLGYRGKHKPTDIDKKVAIQKHKERYPEKQKAKQLTSQMKPLIVGNQLHHWNYAIEFAKDVIELSVKDHNKAHRFIQYDQERMMYRRIDTMELLDTKEKHEAYIRDCIANKPD